MVQKENALCAGGGITVSGILRILLIISAVFTVYYILKRINKEKMKIQNAVFWILFSVIVLILAIVPQIVIQMTKWLGVASPVNFVFLVFIFFAYIKLFSVSAKLSTLEDKIGTLACEEALKRKMDDDMKDKEKDRDCA